MITVARIKSLLSSDLSAVLSENDDNIINDLITKNDAYIVGLLGEISEDVKDFLVEQLVLRDLYQRFGYVEIADSYSKTVENMISKIGGGKIYKKDNAGQNIVYTSRKQIFTEEEFEKW